VIVSPGWKRRLIRMADSARAARGTDDRRRPTDEPVLQVGQVRVNAGRPQLCSTQFTVTDRNSGRGRLRIRNRWTSTARKPDLNRSLTTGPVGPQRANGRSVCPGGADSAAVDKCVNGRSCGGGSPPPCGPRRVVSPRPAGACSTKATTTALTERFTATPAVSATGLLWFAWPEPLWRECLWLRCG
jgi:hypothetical protein